MPSERGDIVLDEDGGKKMSSDRSRTRVTSDKRRPHNASMAMAALTRECVMAEVRGGGMGGGGKERGE